VSPRSTNAAAPSSPLVRKIAAENNIDISRIEGTGVPAASENDILTPETRARAPKARGINPRPAPQFAEGATVRLEPLSVMRKRSRNMIQSKQTSAHVHTVFEIDLPRSRNCASSTRTRTQSAA
jgi:2-oxoglutarate dehydrogenase E2 component (dihydrolipoamide succinyltransferase)